MAWQIKFRPSALKELSKLPKQVQIRILDALESMTASPQAKGKPIQGVKKTLPLWRYRIGDYRAVCFLRDEDRTILALRVGHRKEVNRRGFP